MTTVLASDNRPPDSDSASAGLDRALGAAYRFLNRRERTQAEVRTHLSRAGTTPADVEDAIAALVEQSYLDDARFVRLFVQDKRELEEWGSERIRQALVARGIDPGLVAEALTRSAPDGELDRALAVLRRRFPTLPSERRERERALGVLLRKGYDVELALEAITIHTQS